MDGLNKFATAANYLIPVLGQGLGLVIKITLISFALGIVLGLFIAIGRVSKNKFLNGILTLFIEFIRGTPLLVQIFYAYYVVPLLLEALIGIINPDVSIQFQPQIAGILALALNYSCYLSEVIRGAIESIDKGQTEAALALGYGKGETLFLIILPQALRSVVPVFGNYLVMMIKDTSLLSVITVNELLLRTQIYNGQSFLTIQNYTLLAVAYLIISVPMSQFVKYLEKRLKTA